MRHKESANLCAAPEQLAASLTTLQRRAIVVIEQEGNGAYPFCLQPFAKLGLMALVPVPSLLGISCYRLTDLGRAVRQIVIAQQNG